MPALIVYLLKVNVALCLFYLAYRFALRPLTFYYLNRFFLVSGIIFSTVYPLVDISSLFTRHTAIRQQLTTLVPDWNSVLPIVQHQVQAADNWAAPIILFWVGVALMAVRLAVQFVSLYRIHSKSEQAEHFGQSFRAVRSEVNPFSFWQDIYLNPDKHTDAELRSIIQHEQIHVKQWHTLDVILAELSVVFYWFNPGVWFMKQAVKENLEFITDREILRSGVDEKIYQYSLVRVSALKPGAAIVNNFNFLTIKKRIMMMNKKRSSRANLTRYVVLPLVMLLALIFTVSKAEITNKSISILVKKILPATIAGKTLPAATPITIKATRDTVKPKMMKDSIRRTIVISNNGEETDTLEGPNGKSVLKNVKVVRINGKDMRADTNNIVVLDYKGKPTNLTLTGVTTNDIESINIVNDTAVKAYALTSGVNSRVVVKLRPTVALSYTSKANVSASTTGLSANTATLQGVSIASTNSSSPATYGIDVRPNEDDELVYIIDPKNLSSDNIENIRKKFKENGYNLDVHTDYNGKILKSINIKVNTDNKNKSSSSSASYTNTDISNTDHLIKIIADKTTGALAIIEINR